jgi:GNAT superfamily N-acetyltransferase
VILIREGSSGDRAAVEAVRRASWRAAYSGLIAPAHIERATSRPSAISHPAAWRRTLVAVPEDGAAIVGYAAFGPERSVLAPQPRPPAATTDSPPLTDAGLAGQVGEVYAIYTHPAWWSTGTGRALMAAAVHALREAGYQRAVLWVLASNARARRFYEIAGWTADGGENILHGLGRLLEVRYARRLAVEREGGNESGAG